MKKIDTQYNKIKFWSDLLFSICLNCDLLKCESIVAFNITGLFRLILEKIIIAAATGRRSQNCSVIVLSNNIKIRIKLFAFG